MAINEKMQNFVFKAMLLDSTLGVLADSGLDVRGNAVEESKVKDEESITLDDFPMNLRMNAIKMARVYTAFFCFENSVRDLVSTRLLENKGANWWEDCTTKGIKSRVESRIKKDEKNKWHSPRADKNINYCDFGDLCDMIINNWPEFEDLFPTQDWIRTRLADLEPSRNALAHNNVLMDHDIKRIDMFLRDWILQVG